MYSKKKPQWLPITRVCHHGIPLEELEDRLEMHRTPPIEPAISCYADFCPSDCAVHCATGYTGCTDLCACDGSMCAAECASLCAVDSCIVDII